jgi:hypothetical protein
MKDAQRVCCAELAALTSLAPLKSSGEYVKRNYGHCVLNIGDTD